MQKRLATAALTYDSYLSRAMAALAVLCTLCAFLYGALLLETVAHAAALTSAERQMRTLTAELNTLEGTYLSATQSLTPERAAALGFVSPKTISTVFATAASRSLSLRGQ